jgi:hypothetical protein
MLAFPFEFGSGFLLCVWLASSWFFFLVFACALSLSLFSSRPLLCSAFYKARELAPKPVLPLQDCYPSTNGIVGRGCGHDWVGFAADFPASLLNRDEEDARLYPSNGAVSAEMEIFTLTPASGNLTIGSQIIKKILLILPLD